MFLQKIRFLLKEVIDPLISKIEKRNIYTYFFTYSLASAVKIDGLESLLFSIVELQIGREPNTSLLVIREIINYMEAS